MKTNKPQKFNATVLFCDIRKFTTLFDEKPPEEAFSFANYVLSSLSKVIIKNKGTVDKIMGDGILAHFGITDSQKEHAKFACICALKILDEITVINSNYYFLKKPIISVGIGINTGDVVFGNITVGNKLVSSIYGDVVNTASKIEHLTRNFLVDIICSESTYLSCSNYLNFNALGKVNITGKKNQQSLYWLLPTNFSKIKKDDL
ncbi:adenylate/guanylate cyclase domain-containing protein [Pigmentibacter sp. JX0631]|uniref:adenylate/guanylate cyclase domain-containing protein n=1 Tax=Pigmentibacter sp. JX0631 TaxID=2976982 RepID=UPI00246981AC|nr:adenylate/guanylate cyclase domain-containing protein [Pigmentibacter sp. JX0631]WGL60113.1 adenylate/guanylate cyclase domain-containing protein [Pigmentibacter sp. JX0631]